MVQDRRERDDRGGVTTPVLPAASGSCPVSLRENFVRAVERRGPEHVPLVVVGQPDLSDGVLTVLLPAAGYQPRREGETEWGYAWKSLDDTVGQPDKPVLSSWDEIRGFAPPDPRAPGRFYQLEEMRREHPGKYLMLSPGITGFTLMAFLIGFEELLEGLCTEDPHVDALADIVFGFEEGVIRGAASHGADAVCFYDDWGTQHSLIVAPDLWRKVFKARYARQFKLAHDLGMHVDFHSCGDVYEIIGDLIEIGADMLNLNQPRLLGLERLAADFGGDVCFFCPVDVQRTLVNGTEAEVRAEAGKLIDLLGRPDGGFVALVEPFYAKMTASPGNLEEAIQAFRELGTY